MFDLSIADKKLLLKIARKSLEFYFDDKIQEQVDTSANNNLKINTGVFVTLRIDDKLRGCIGYLNSQNILPETVFDAARQAAFNDPRFFPLLCDELYNLSIEISVLTPPYEINSYNEIIIGKHGLLLDTENSRGLLLPQVAVEHNMNIQEYLSAICEKAGLYPKYWEEKNLKLKVFEAIVFSEKDFWEENE